MRNMWLMLILIAACRISGEHFTPGDGPRLIAPLSMTTVTQQKPTLRWVLDLEGGSPVVDLCRDRACTMSLPMTVRLADDHLSAVPTDALPAGWVFWRVSIVVGTHTLSSATWQFWVGKSSASTPVDTSNGAILDVNGDGYPDILVGASRAGIGAGAAHLYFGSATAGASGWNGTIDLANPDDAKASFGWSVASVGDVNGDGFADFLVGAPDTGTQSGAAHLYLGSVTPSVTDWSGTSTTQRIDLINPDGAAASFGWSVASAGDVNGDGYADFLIGARGANSNAGAAHLYLGAPAPGATDWNAASPTQRIDLTNPPGTGMLLGISVASAGDVNGDGLADFLVGAEQGGPHLYLGAAIPRP